MKKLILMMLVVLFISINLKVEAQHNKSLVLEKDTFLTYLVDKKRETIDIYWKDDTGQPYKYFYDLNIHLTKKGNYYERNPVFMCNGGIFMENYTPLGLYIRNEKVLHSINTKSNSIGNFYKKPNGIFFIDKKGNSSITKTEYFYGDYCPISKLTRHAIQSGPVMIWENNIMPSCMNTKSLCKRNGVGITKEGKTLFVLSMRDISMYSFAKFFKDSGCVSALFLDGGISDAFCPSKGKSEGATAFSTIIVVFRK